MNCLNCDEPTKNPKFCSQSCSATYNNKRYPKRSPEGKCLQCCKPITTSLSFCDKICRKAYNKSKPPSERSKFCPLCKIEKNEQNAFAMKGTTRQSYCRKCNSKKTAGRARKFKVKCVAYKGGKCEMCGYDKCVGSMDFHHTDPTQKDFGIASQKGRVLTDRIKAELDKCKFLCANCHREEHYRLSELTNEYLT